MSLSPSHRSSTSTDVARTAGVSRATVSHILNGYEGKFSSETAERVRKAADELGYRPSLAGRALVRGRSDIALVVVPAEVHGLRLQDALDELAGQTAALGLTVLTRYASGPEGSSADAALFTRPAVVVDFGGLSAEERAVLHAAGIPFVPRLSGPAVGLRFESLIGELQVDALVRAGRPILFAQQATGRHATSSMLDRQRGVRDACVRRGLPEPRILQVPLELRPAVAVLQRLRGGEPVSIACYNDEVASALHAAALALGIAVPAEVALIGVDATPLGQLLDPPLTSVRVDLRRTLQPLIQELRAALDPEGDRPAEDHDASEMLTLLAGGTVAFDRSATGDGRRATGTGPG